MKTFILTANGGGLFTGASARGRRPCGNRTGPLGQPSQGLSRPCAFRNSLTNSERAHGGGTADKTDVKILQILRRDARTPFVDVAKKVGMTEGAIRARVKKLQREGTIERFTVVARAGGLRAIVGVRTKPGASTDRVAQSIRRVGGVDSVLEVTGEVDLFAFVATDDTRGLNRAIEHIRRLPSVVETKSMTILNEH
jgi:Lrp/AsnC family transcriptional regulator for asnA, asnC and gidA